MFGTSEPNATQLVAAVIVTIVIITIGRMVLRYFLHALTTTRVLVVGAGTTVDRIMLSVRQDAGMTLVGRVVDGDTRRLRRRHRPGRPICPNLPRAGRPPDPGRRPEDEFSAETLDIYRQLQDRAHRHGPRYYELISWRSRLTDLSGMPFLEIAQPHLSAWDKFMKRTFDIVISSAVLLLTSPLLLVVAIGVKLSSPGPVFFRQIRLGRDSQPFTVTKFRSMTVGRRRGRPDASPPDGADSSARGDHVPEDESDSGRSTSSARQVGARPARITRFGAFLRRTGIDEIPQFINVFKGDMSVVGPRPFIPRSPAWTAGLPAASTSVPASPACGRCPVATTSPAATSSNSTTSTWPSWSLWWDLKIMFETPKTMARGTGAY